MINNINNINKQSNKKLKKMWHKAAAAVAVVTTVMNYDRKKSVRPKSKSKSNLLQIIRFFTSIIFSESKGTRKSKFKWAFGKTRKKSSFI